MHSFLLLPRVRFRKCCALEAAGDCIVSAAVTRRELKHEFSDVVERCSSFDERTSDLDVGVKNTTWPKREMLGNGWAADPCTTPYNGTLQNNWVPM